MSGFGDSGQATVARPQMVTVAGWLFVIGGVFGALGGLGLMGLGGMFGGVVGSGAFIFGLITLALSVAEAWTGLQILKLTAKGLQFGNLVSYASIAITLLMAFAFGYGFGTNSLLGLLFPVFVLWVLNQNKALFTR